MADLATVPGRLAAARALGLPVPDGLDDAPPAVVDAALRRLAQDGLAATDVRVAELERQRGILAANRPGISGGSIL